MRLTLFSLLFTLTLFAQAPYNSNYLVERGIDPDIINNIISTTRQEVAYRMHINHTTTQNYETTNLDYYMIVDPYPTYGAEIQLQVPKDELKDIDEDAIKHTLDEFMGLQLYLQHGKLYDEDSFKLLSSDSNNTIISFKFLQDALPRELNHIQSMNGFVYIKNSILQSISITNNSKFTLEGVEVTKYKKELFFKRVKSGGYLVSSHTLLIEGKYKDTPYTEYLSSKIVEYWARDKKEITFENGLQNNIVTIEDTKYKIIALDFDRIFPLLGKDARKAGYDLPKPFGITLVNMFQDTTMHMTSFKLDGVNYDFNNIFDGDSKYKSITYAPLLRADVWVLPFVSFSLLLGGTDTTTNVTLVSDSGITLPVLGEIIPPNTNFTLDPFGTNSVLYGLGATIAGGFNNYFSTIDFQYITAYTQEADVSIDMMIITPLVGYNFQDYGTKVFMGAQYQRLAQSITFELDVPGSSKNLSGVVGLRSEEWAGVMGVDYSFTRNWGTNILYSKGKDRTNAVLSISYRY